MRSRLSLAILILTATTSHAQFGDIFKKKDPNTASQSSTSSRAQNTGLTNDKITAGLKQALEVSTANAVALTGKPDGFLKNDAIRIPLPEKLQTVGKGLRMIGMGGQVDELEVGMNRAAEQATPKAKAIFLAAVKKMTFDDARRIWSGNDTAATEYFRGASSADLTAAFTPIVHAQLAKLGVIQKYNSVIQSTPGGSAFAVKFDLDKYVVGKTLDGLFYTLGQEEKKIRKDPAAQTTSLLRTVFGRR
jgi:Protein of unknown function (DUF4197)